MAVSTSRRRCSGCGWPKGASLTLGLERRQPGSAGRSGHPVRTTWGLVEPSDRQAHIVAWRATRSGIGRAVRHFRATLQYPGGFDRSWGLAGLLYLGAGSGLAVIYWGRPLVGLPSPKAKLQGRDWPWLAAAALFGGLLGPLLLMLGLSQTSGASGSPLLNLKGLATMAIAWVVFREKLRLKEREVL